jgi:BlaI family transcriptional regulator, penicillinase repressor
VKKSHRPTEAELEILGVLWARGPATVRAVYEAICARRPSTYTTVLKMMQIMTAKGLVTREELQRAHIYRACAPREQTQQQLVGDLVTRAFDGSVARLVEQALAGAPKASAEELAEIRSLIENYKGEDRES